MISKSKIFLFLILAFIIGFLVGFKILINRNNQPNSQSNNQPRIVINNKTIFVEMADTAQKRSQGLSDRDRLEPNRGMLFVFDTPGKYSFWMDKMKFNLDFVFINGETVVDLAKNIPYPKEGEKPQVITAQQSFDKVLEINEGMVKKLNIKIGDKMKFL